MARITYRVFGKHGAARTLGDGFAISDRDSDTRSTPLDAVKAKFYRLTGCTVWPCRQDSWTQDRDGKCTSRIYQASLSRKARNGSVDVEGTLWFVIDEEA